MPGLAESELCRSDHRRHQYWISSGASDVRERCRTPTPDKEKSAGAASEIGAFAIQNTERSAASSLSTTED